MQSDTPNPIPQVVIDNGSEDVMRQFQQLMSQFLQTQTMVMTAYLQGTQGTPIAGLPTLPAMAPIAQRAPVSRSVPAVTYNAPPVATPAQREAVPVQMPPIAAPAPQPIAVPSKAPAQPVPAVAAAPVAAGRLAAAPPQARASAADVLSQLLTIVSDRTGYPQDMLDPDANMEADLGIDSIKRMEVLTAFQQLHAGQQRGAFQGAMEKLTAIKTLRETASILTELLASQAEAAVA